MSDPEKTWRDRARRGKVVAMVPAASALLALTLTACGPHAPIQHCGNGSVTRLYMGQATPSGNVTDAEWQQFITETVTPRFPEGFTVLHAQGQWRGRDGGIHREDTRVLEIVHHNDPASQAQVRALAHAYKRRFSQESVLLTQLPSYQCS
jgi:Protein of unknown function (DUF3574)